MLNLRPATVPTYGLRDALSPHISFISVYFLAFTTGKVSITTWVKLVLLVWGCVEKATREVQMLCLHLVPHSGINSSLLGALVNPEEPKDFLIHLDPS